MKRIERVINAPIAHQDDSTIAFLGACTPDVSKEA